MRFAITGNDKDTGQPIELVVEAADVPCAVAVADQKGIRVTGVRAVDAAIAPPRSPSRPREGAPPAPEPRPVAPPKLKTRLWFGLLLLVSGFLAPFFPSYTLGVGIVLAALVLLYLLVGPMRRRLGYFLRVSPQRPGWRVVKLTTLGAVAMILMVFAVAGYAVQREAAEAATKKAADEAARALAETAANGQVTELIEKARAALTAGDIATAQESIDEALEIRFARNRGLASDLQSAIRNSGDPEWSLITVARLSIADFEAFTVTGKTPAALDLGYEVLTEKAVASARNQLDAVATRRTEIKKQKEDAAEARRQQAEALLEERRKVAEAKAAAEAAERAQFEKAQGETIHVGYTSYCAWDSHWSNRLSSNEFLNKRANASWLFVNMTIRNDDKKARMVPPIKLIDGQGREYDSSSEGTMIENSIGVLETLNPDVSKNGFVVFDVPKGRTYRLKLSGGYWSSAKGYIRLEPTER